MRITPGRFAAALIVLLLVWSVAPPRAEVIEEVVAWVNGEIITKSDYEAEEQSSLAELYRQYAGEQLDQMVETARKELLLNLIDRAILLGRAERHFDMPTMRNGLYQEFLDRQGITDEAEFAKTLQQQGYTVDEWKNRLLNMYAPEQVIRFEVSARLAVGESEIENFYERNRDEFLEPGMVTLAEIVLMTEGSDKEQLRAKAEELRQRVADGADFAEIARTESQSPSAEAGGMVGKLAVRDLAEQLQTAVAELSVSEVSPVLEMPYGFQVIKIEAKTGDYVRPLDEVRDEVRAELENEKFQTELAAFLRKARDEAEWCVKPRYKKWLPIPAPSSCTTTF